MMRNITLALLLIPILLVSGCTQISGFGADALTIQKTENWNGADDVLIIADSFTIPKSDFILPNQQMTLSYSIENVDKLKAAQNVRMDLFDPSSFKDAASGKACYVPQQNAPSLCVPFDCYPGKPCTLYPGDVKQIDYKLQSPSESEIAGIKFDTSLETKLLYDFEGSLLYTFPVVNMDEIIKRQRTNEKTTINIAKSYGSGPIKITVDMQGNTYVLADQDSILFFNIENRGKGLVQDSNIPVSSYTEQDMDASIPKKGLIIRFPAGVQLPDYQNQQDPNSQFNCAASSAGGWICTNKEAIKIYKDKSQVSMRFKINVPTTALTDAPFKSFTLDARVGYTYELRNSVSVSVNPNNNV